MAEQLNHYRLLGRSGLRVSPLSLGTMTFGVEGAWGSKDDEAAQMVALFIDRGGNFFDTADFYGGFGGSERLLGKLLKGRRPRQVIATKYSLTTSWGDPNASGNHRKNMVQSVEDSLRRLDTDYIDLLYLHMWDFRTPPEEILRAFDDLVRAGKIIYVGLSDIPAWEASRMQAIADLRGWSPSIALQIQYNLTERTVERELIPMAQATGMGVVPWAPLASGILTGKYSAEDLNAKPPEGAAGVDTRRDMNLVTGKLTRRALDIADVVKEVARELGRTPAQVAVAWTLLNPAVASSIIGVRTLVQLQDNLGSLEIDLTADQIERLDHVSRVEAVFPYDVLKGRSEPFMFGGVKVAKRHP